MSFCFPRVTRPRSHYILHTALKPGPRLLGIVHTMGTHIIENTFPMLLFLLLNMV